MELIMFAPLLFVLFAFGFLPNIAVMKQKEEARKKGLCLSLLWDVDVLVALKSELEPHELIDRISANYDVLLVGTYKICRQIVFEGGEPGVYFNYCFYKVRKNEREVNVCFWRTLHKRVAQQEEISFLMEASRMNLVRLSVDLLEDYICKKLGA